MNKPRPSRIIQDFDTALEYSKVRGGRIPRGWEKEFAEYNRQKRPPTTPQGTPLERAALRVEGQKFIEPSRLELPYPGTISAKADTFALRKAGVFPGGLPKERKMDLTGVVNRLRAGTASRADSLLAEQKLEGIFGDPFGPEAIAKAEEGKLKKAEKKRTTAKSARGAYQTALKGKNSAITYLAKIKEGATPAEAEKSLDVDEALTIRTMFDLLGLSGKVELTSGDIQRIEQSIGKLIGSYDETITGYENKRLDDDIVAFEKQYPASQYDGQTATDAKTGLKLMSQNGEWVILDKIEGN